VHGARESGGGLERVAAGGALLRAGAVGAPHGLDGSFHVVGAIPALLNLGAPVTVAGVSRAVTRRGGHDRRLILRIEGCENRDAASALRGSELFVERTRAPVLEPDEWWAEDLEGCLVQDGTRSVGVVRRLLALPSCEVLEVSRSDGADLLVPLIGDAVRTVDVERRVIDVDLGFLGEGA
jgi:16S rRNA processing protein RimM